MAISELPTNPIKQAALFDKHELWEHTRVVLLDIFFHGVLATSTVYERKFTIPCSINRKVGKSYYLVRRS